MNLPHYQRRSAATAFYPGIGQNLAYPTLGLAGEAAELADKLEALALSVDTADAVRETLKEAGDTLWYVAQVASEAGLDIEDVQAAATPLQTEALTLAQLGATTFKGCGVVSELVKKAFRDDGGQLTDVRRAKLAAALGHILLALDLVARRLGSDIAVVAERNIAKLADRAARGQLGGSGDRR